MKKILPFLLLCLPFFGIAQTTHVVTFKVNTANITVGPNGLFAGGGVLGLANALQLSDPDGNGVYEGSTTLTGNAGGNFGFFNSPAWDQDWGTKENLAGLPCADPGNYDDRIMPTFTQDTTLLFCFGTCATDTLCTTTYTATSCGDLFFSEYAEGSSSNKYFEIYNPTAGSINLSDYEVHLFSNGATTASYVLDFHSGTILASGDVFVVSNSGSDPSILAFADTSSTTTYFNGNDALALLKNTDTLDILGEVGVSSNWPVGSGSTSNNTLVRKSNIDMGTTDWTQSSSQWDVYPSNTWTYGGTHSSNCILTPKNVTFQVDMSYVTASFTNVYVSGTLNSWSGNSNQLTDPDGDGVYTGTLSLMPGSYEYKFTYDNWTGQESLNATLDSACTITTNGFTNRYATFGNADTTLPAVCWEDCAACAGPTDFVVTFKVNTANITVGPNGLFAGGGVLGLANALQLSDPDGNGVYEGSTTLTGNAGGNFGFFNSPAWDQDWGTKENLAGLPCADPGNYNDRIMPTFTQDTTLLFCFGSCVNDTVCPAAQADYLLTLKVNTANITVGPNGLYAGGGILGNARALQLTDADGNGVYEADTLITGQGGGNFIFLNSPANDNDWGTKENLGGLPCADPNNYDDRIMPSFGQDTTLGFCFGTCATDTVCPVLPTAQNYTFQVDLSTLGSTSAYIRGANINNWAFPGVPMSDADGDGIWDITLSLMPGNYEFKYTAGTVEETLDPTLNGACTVTNFGFTNRYVTLGSADSTLPVVCWQECTACAPASTGCDELFFSEYLEGSGNNKVLELYNPTSSTISLGNYEIRRFNNGGTNPSTMTFPSSLSIPAYGTYVIANPSSASTILASADTTSSITYFNGDDAIVLMNGTDTVDIIGVVGFDPGNSWPVGTGATANNTLVRMASVSAGQKDWTIGATEWDVYPSNTDTYLGGHNSNCAPPAPTFDSVVAINTFNSNDANGVADSLGAMKWIKVIVTSIDFDGNAGYSFYGEDATDGVNIYNFADQSGYTAPMMGDSLYIHGEVEQFRGLTELKPDSIFVLNSGNALPAASVETTLDETTESELIQLIGFTLADATQWPAAGLSANVDITNGTDTMTMRIDSDTDIDGSNAPSGAFDVTGIGSQYDFSSPYDEGYQIFPRQLTDIYEYPTIPVYQISDVTYVDAMGMPDSLNVLCKLEGIVLGVDMQGSATAVSFTLHDGVDGIGTYGSLANYTVAEGDSVRIIGSIGQYNGLLQMVLDSVVLISSNNALPTTPTVVTALGENTESELIKFENASIVDPSQWSGGSGYSVDITNGTDTIVMRIDADTDIYGTAAPTGVFDVVGIGGQFTFNAGDFDGYQLLPRYQADITPAAGVVAVKLSVSEIMAGSNSTAYNADWFEIHNYGDSAVDLTGYSWDDESEIPGTSTFPSVTIQAGQAIVVLDDVAANKDAFLAEWKLYAGSVTIVANDELTGSFPSLSQNGDAVFLYDANGAEMASGAYTAATAGFSGEFDTTGAFLGDAVDGTNGAYTSLEGDVGSPGNLTPNTGVGEATVISSIFPNPTTGSFTVNLTSAVSYEATITNITGATVFHKEGTGAELNIDLDAARGTYVLRVRTAQGTAVQMIVLQ